LGVLKYTNNPRLLNYEKPVCSVTWGNYSDWLIKDQFGEGQINPVGVLSLRRNVRGFPRKEKSSKAQNYEEKYGKTETIPSNIFHL
jgi:hypothetical protein